MTQREVGLHFHVSSETSSSPFSSPDWCSTVQCTPIFSSLSVWGMCGICLKAASQAWFVRHDVFFDISMWQETLPHSWKYLPHKQCMCLVKASFYFSYSCHEQYSFNIYSVFKVLAFIFSKKKGCLYQCTVLTFLSWILQKYWLFRIKWKKSRIAWINDVGIFTEILLGKGWHI